MVPPPSWKAGFHPPIIWQWSLTKEYIRYLVWAKPEFIYMLLCYHCFTHSGHSVPVIFPKWKPNSAKNTLWKKFHIGLPRLKGGFTGLRPLSDSQIISLQIPIALYQRRGKWVIGEEECQINNPTKPYIIPLQVLNT